MAINLTITDMENETKPVDFEPIDIKCSSVIKFFAFIEFLAGIAIGFLAGAIDKYGGVEFHAPTVIIFIILGLVSCVLTLGFAKIVKAAEKYLEKNK